MSRRSGRRTGDRSKIMS